MSTGGELDVCRGKRRYVSAAEAHEAIRRQQQRRRRDKRRHAKGPCKVYRCALCHGYHTSSS